MLDQEDFDNCFKVSDLDEVQNLNNKDLFLLTHATDDYGNYESKKITLQRVIKAVKNRGLKTEINLIYDIQDKYFPKSEISGYTKVGHTHTKANITDFPTKLSQFQNDVPFLSSHQDISNLALKSEIPSKVSELSNDVPFLSSHQDISHLVDRDELTAYAPVHHEHSVDDISNFPSNVSHFDNDAGYLTAVYVPTKVSELSNDVPFLSSHQDISHLVDRDELTAYSIVGHTHKVEDVTDFPSNVSYFNNDAGYLTSVTVPTKISDLENDIPLSTYSEIHDQLSNDGYGVKTIFRDWT